MLALETENKDLSDKIGKLETELEKTHKELEQSETCCTEWEKQALDYKAENIALSGDLECTREQLVIKCNQLEIAVDALDRMAIHDSIYDIIAKNAIKKIKELEQKE